MVGFLKFLLETNSISVGKILKMMQMNLCSSVNTKLALVCLIYFATCGYLEQTNINDQTFS